MSFRPDRAAKDQKPDRDCLGIIDALRFAVAFAWPSASNSIPARMAMMAVTAGRLNQSEDAPGCLPG